LSAKASIWSIAPEPAIPEPPAIVSDSYNLWLAYYHSPGERIAVVRFSGLVDHRLSPINDEGLGQHPYAKFGLKFYSFNELTGSVEIQRWSSLGVRHWVITFKDNTLDVLARTGEVLVSSMSAPSPLTALLSVLNQPVGDSTTPDCN
jgi:hypothetical protein